MLFKVMSMNSILIGVKFVLGILSVKIISIFLGPSGMAVISHLRDFASMFKSFSSLGINNAVIKSVKDTNNDSKEISSRLSSFFWSYVVISIVLALLIILLASHINWFLFRNYDYLIIIKLIGLLLPLYFVNLFLKALLNSLELYKSIIWIQVISTICLFCFTFLCIYYKNLFGALLALSITDVIILIITFVFVRKNRRLFDFNLKKNFRNKDLKFLRKYGLMALITAIIVPVTAILIRNNIIFQEGQFKAGIWDSSKRISSFYMMFISSGLTLYYVPKLASLKTDKDLKIEIKKYFVSILPIFLIILLLVFFLKDFIIKMALTKEFFEVKTVLIWQLIGDFVKVATLAFGFILSVRAMVIKYIAIELLFNLSYLALAKFLLVDYSIEGVVFSYMVANILTLFLMLWFFRKLIFFSANQDELQTS